MLKKVSALSAVALAVASLATPAEARVRRGTDGFIAVDTVPGGPGLTLPASALTLLTGATADNQSLTASPTNENSYNFPIGGIAIFDMFVRHNSSRPTARVSTNGYISFDQYSRYECTIDQNNRSLTVPSSSCRAPRIMPFFDDLAVVGGLSTITTGNTTGTAADFWYVQWNDFALASNPAARITVRATYFEASRSVRFNYIKLDGVGTNGIGATIGATQCLARNRGGERPYIQYSFNEAVLPSGTATAGSSLFAIDISRDGDGDGLPASMESLLGTSDSNFDSDGCGEGDGSEVAGGRNPASANCTGPDDLVADADSDTLTDADELFLGTTVNDDDTDNDFAPDGAELKLMNTDPLLADTDEDGAIDGEEDRDFDGTRDDWEDDNQDGVLEPSEDDNDNGVLDSGEDTNGNGVLDLGEDNDDDGKMDLQESNPNDRQDYPGMNLVITNSLGVSINVEPNHAEAALDAAGNLHYVAEERAGNYGVLYGMLKPDGSVGTRMSMLDTNPYQVRKPHVFVSGTTVTVLFTAHPSDAYADDENDPRDAGIGFMQFTAGSGDGNPLASSTPTTLRYIDVPGAVTHWSVVFDATGGAHAFYPDGGGFNHSSGAGTASRIRYVRLTADGQIADTQVLASYDIYSPDNETTGTGESLWGLHRAHDPRAVVGPDGRVHVMWLASTGPRNQTWRYEEFPTGVYYAILDGEGGVRGPIYVMDGRFERIDVATDSAGKLLYIAGSSKRSSDDNFNEEAGIRAAVIDLNAFSVKPREGDAFGVEWAVADGAFILPVTTIFNSGNGGSQGARLLVMPNGNAWFQFTEDGSDSINLVSFNPYGVLNSHVLELQVADGEHYRESRRPVLLPFGGDVATLVAEWNNGDLRFARYRNALLPSPDFGGVNGAPVITSLPPAGSFGVGQTLSYQVVANDDTTAADALEYTLNVGPESATMSAAGVLAWTPTTVELGDSLFVVRVCDDNANLPRCATQQFVITVTSSGSGLRISSVPTGVAYVGKAYRYNVLVEGGATAPVTYSIAAGQVGNMAIDSAGAFTWTPGEVDIGIVALQLRAVDASGRSADQAFNIAVSNNASPPEVNVEDGGCGCTSASGSDSMLLGLGALAWLLVRRRKVRA